MHGRNTGKKIKAVRIVQQALEIVALLNPDQNPIQVLIDAVKNGGPREDSCKVGSSGTVRRQAVDVRSSSMLSRTVALAKILVRSVLPVPSGDKLSMSGPHRCCQERWPSRRFL